MNYLIWRLHRNQAFFAGAVLALMTILLLVTGITMAHDYHVFLANCAATRSCGDTGQLFSGDGAIIDMVNLTVVVPLLFGLFWGAPLLAKEFEDGTHNLVWTQGVTRGQWLRGKMLWALVAAWLGTGHDRSGQLVALSGERPQLPVLGLRHPGIVPSPTPCSPWRSVSPSAPS